MIFTERVRELRKEKGLTQVEVAQAVGITSRAFQTLEAGKNPGFVSLIKLADFFNVSIDYLVGRTDDRRLHR